MNFEYTKDQLMIRNSVKDFAEKFIRPHMMEWDENEIFPTEVFRKMGEQGYLGVLVPEQYGGAAMSYHEYAIIISEIAKVCGSIGLSIAAHNSLCTGHILQSGNEDQKQRWLPGLASGASIGAWGLTEANTGSDAGNLRTTAKKIGDKWVINGTKNFITHGQSADVYVIIARTGEPGDKRAMTAFVLEKGTPGLSGGRKERKLGMRASETTEVILDQVEVSDDHVLGKVGEGFIQALKILDGGRISIAALALGIAEGAFEAALSYSGERHQFGQPINQFQGISMKLSNMATKIEAAKLLIHQAADMKNKGQNVTKVASMAKLYASEIAVEVANEGVQIFGGYGYTKDFPAEKYYRDAKLCTIGEGTSEIQKLVIAREVLKA